MNKKILIKSYINQKMTSYKKFMLIEKMPMFEIMIEENIKTPSHNYDVKIDKHVLKVETNIMNRNMEYILFHEFTHMYDVINFSAKNPYLYFANRGFTEYHASQIELLKLLDAKTVNDKISFSLAQPIETILGETTILNYMLELRDSAREGITEKYYVDNLKSFSNVLGMIFNHLGRVSICRLYANDYEAYKEELENFELELSFLGEEFSKIVSIARGILDDREIEEFARKYYPMAEGLIRKHIKNL